MVGQQVRFRMPHTLEEAVQLAVTVSNAERLRAPDTKGVLLSETVRLRGQVVSIVE